MSVPEILHPRELTLEDGILLVRLARKAVKTYLSSRKIIQPPPDTPRKLLKRGMSFVTIERLVGGRRELRGCIGFLEPQTSLIESVIRSAILAATEDPRFEPMTLDELGNVVFEVSVLSGYEKVENPLQEVIIGRHGIYVVHGTLYRGVLLPQVPVEYCWDVETFLAEGCLKAGLPPDAWLHEKTDVYVFEAAVFIEKEPEGEIVIRDLIKEYREKCL